MHNIPGAAFSSQAVRKFQNEFNDLMIGHVRHLQGLIVQNSVTIDGKAIIPRSAQQRLLTDAGNYVQRIFVGSDYRSAYASDGVTPLADYPRLLNKWLAWVTYKVVDSHAKYMARQLPDDIQQWLSNRVAVEMVGGNPLAVYSAPHTWVDPRGYRLSDRIWGVSVRTRTQIDNLLLEGINTGRSALDIAKDLEQFLLPNRAPFRTRRPYGADASFDAMRLARSEIARAHSYASYAAATANPFVDGWDFALSAQHPKIDICDTLATIGMDGQRIKDPYPLDAGNVPIPVESTHPQCCVPGQSVVTLRGKVLIEEVKEGDFVITHQNEYRRVRYAWSRRYSGLVYRIQTESGEFEITSEHPVLTRRGWINAKGLQLTDEVIYTSPDIGMNSLSGISEDNPALFTQSSVTDSIFFGIMPIFPIAFNVNLEVGDCEIQKVLSRTKFILARYVSALQLFLHGAFNTGHCPTHPAHFNHAWIVPFFGLGNFKPNVWSFGNIFFSKFETTDFSNSFGLFSPTFAIVSLPLPSDTFTSGSQRYPNVFQDSAKLAKLYTQKIAQFWRTHDIYHIPFIQKVSDITAKLGLYSGNVIHCSFDANARATTFASAQLTTNNTRNAFGGHDNHLSLSPDVEMGAASGNAVVSRVANPAQAHSYYSKIQAITPRHYDGLVYNMHVDDHNSYTVNGAVVHNCICTGRPAVIRSRKEIIDHLRAMMGQGDGAPITPIDAYKFLKVLLGAYLANLVFTEILQQLGVQQ